MTAIAMPGSTHWRDCKIGACQRHRDCMYAPCRSAAAPPIRIGDRVPPAPKPKLDVRPKAFSDDKARGPRGVFTNGSR